MTDLTDNEINEILECLEKQGIDYIMSKEEMKKLLKENATKSKLLNINLDDIELDDNENNENNEINENKNNINDIENSIIEKNIDSDIEKNIQSDIENNINNKQNFILKNDSEINEIIEDSNKRLQEVLYKKNKIQETHSNISQNLKNIRKKLDENYNSILDTQDKLSINYISKLNSIKDTLNESINKSQKTKKSNNKFTIPPLNLDQIDNYDLHLEKYETLHNKILNRSKNIFSNPTPPQSSFSSQPQYYQPDSFQPNRFSPPIQSTRYGTRPSPLLTSRYPPPPKPPNHFSGYYTERYPYQNKYTTEKTPPPHPRTNLEYLQRYNRPSDYYQEYKPPSMYDRYKKDKYVDFDELCKKYENQQKDNEHEIIITASGPPSNAMDIINNALDKFEREFYLTESKNEKSTLRDIFNKFKNYKKNPLPKYDKDELAYYDSLEDKKKDKIDKLEIKISQINNVKTPLRFRVLQSNLPLYNKSMIINKIEDLFSNKLLGGSEITKYSNWVNSLLKVPFKKYKKLPIDVESSNEEDIGKYLIDVKKTLDSAVYGHTKTKEQVIQIIAQWITNPNCIGNCIGIQGVMGNGKTTLVKNGIAKAIGRPFAFITLGGCSDSSFLEGHNYTYEGSMWGKIVDVLIECKCMNPVFYFDELDKVSDTPKGEEIINSLIHLTDSSQNNQYADKYFNGIEFDLSKSLFIFSYNDITKINPILLDRLICIKTAAFELDDKIHIAKNYLLKEIYEQLKIKEDTYKIEDDNIKYIIETYTNDEGGVRTLKKHLYNIFSKFNLLNLTQNDESIKYSFDLDKDILKKKEITNEIIDTFIKESTDEKDEYFKNWYM